MGNNAIRQLKRQEVKWVDKDFPRHKHDYSVHAVMRLRKDMDTGGYSYSYFDVMKCKHCNSFKAIPAPGAYNGFIPYANYDRTLPMVYLYSSHKWVIGFSDAVLDPLEY